MTDACLPGPAAAAAAAAAGEEGEKYTPIGRIGGGSYGQVLRVRRRADEAELCMKLVPVQGLSEEQLAETTLEAAVLAILDHPNVIRYVDSFTRCDEVGAPSLAIVMELADNGDLGSLISRHRRSGALVAEEELWRLSIQMCDGVGYLHDQRVLHRDLKPSNVLLDSANNVKLADFGFGRVLQQHERWAHSGVGTPLYFSPELCRGVGYDARTDVWALGCIIYELAALEPPFAASSFVALVDTIMHRQPHELPTVYSIELRFLVLQMLEKDPMRRPYISQVQLYPALLVRRTLADDRAQHGAPAAQLTQPQSRASKICSQHKHSQTSPSTERHSSIRPQTEHRQASADSDDLRYSPRATVTLSPGYVSGSAAHKKHSMGATFTLSTRRALMGTGAPTNMPGISLPVTPRRSTGTKACSFGTRSPGSLGPPLRVPCAPRRSVAAPTHTSQRGPSSRVKMRRREVLMQST